MCWFCVWLVLLWLLVIGLLVLCFIVFSIFIGIFSRCSVSISDLVCCWFRVCLVVVLL